MQVYLNLNDFSSFVILQDFYSTTPLFTLQMFSELYNALSSLQDVEQKCQAGLSECAAVSSDAGASKKTNISNEILPIRLFP